MDTRRLGFLFALLCTLSAGRISTAQCPGAWISGEGPAGVNNTVAVLKVMPNGDLIAGGNFTTAGGVTVNYVARWNGSAWSALGGGVSLTSGTAYVRAAAVLPNGDLVISGRFDNAGGVAANHIARWDGTNWHALGTGMSGGFETRVQALEVLSNGDLVAGGDFSSVGGSSAKYIARWNGSAWSAMGSGFTEGGVTGNPVNALRLLPGGDLIVGGLFTYADGVLVNNIARWNGTTYSSLGSGVTNPNPGVFSSVHDLALLPNGDLIAGGYFIQAGGAPAHGIARWNGTNWFALGGGVGVDLSALAVLDSGDLIAGGSFNTPASRIARWNGTTWSALGAGVTAPGGGSVWTLAVLPDGDLIVGGNFTTAGGLPASRIARWRLTCPTGDLDADNDVDDADQQILVAILLDIDTNPGHTNRADVNHDGNVDGLDIGSFAACRLGACP